MKADSETTCTRAAATGSSSPSPAAIMPTTSTTTVPTKFTMMMRRARRIIMVNFVGTVVVDVVGMIAAGLGLLEPVAAALVHVVSESAFILNSARLVPRHRRRS